MLLSLMRKHAKSWLIKFLIGIIAVVFVFYFGYSFRSGEGLKIASVNGDVITGVEYQEAYRNLLEGLQREYKNVWSDNLIEVFDLKNRALQGLINQKLVSQEAKRIGLDVTEKEVQEKILSYPPFQFKGRFDEGRYRTLLLNNRMKPEDFEAAIGQGLREEKIQQFLMTFSPVTEQEVLDQYTFLNQQVKISFVQFLPERFKKSIKIDQASLEKYFDEHKEDYRISEKVKLTYIVIEPETFRNKVAVTEQEIKEFYEYNLETFKVKKQVRARHILFKLDKDAAEEEVEKVKEKAMAVLEKAKKGEDFTGLAKKYSEGPTGKDGGDLGFFSQGQMVKPFEDAAFKMKKGEISDLVKSDFGFHIIKLEEIKEAGTKDLQEVRKQISEALTNMAAMDLAHEAALSLVDQMPYKVDLKQYASERRVTAKVTDYFAQNEPIPTIDGDERLKQSLFSLEKDEVSEVIEYKGKFYIFQVADKKASALPSLEEVRVKVKDDYLSLRALEEAKSAAEAYLAKLKAGKEWAELSQESGLEPQTTDFFTRQGGVANLGYSPELMEAAFSISEKKRYPERAFQIDEGVVVIRWEGQKEIDRDKYEKEKKSYSDVLAQVRRQAVYRDWLENLKKNAQIEILKSL
ncbi:MAG: SurA N-terminal domain-containing protein [Proteobacteria bacterium]|nr:SurA N-terminal domain-containing protein [Pseudomonadota bacterium]